MSKTSIWITSIIVVIVVVIIGWWIYAMMNTSTNYNTSLNSEPSQTPSNTIQLGSSAKLGSFLTDANGKTLYYFANDTAGKSNCIGACLTLWTPFYSANVVVPTELNATNFAQITTTSGVNQTTYNGWPLYYYSGDKNAGDTNGQGLQNIWFVVTNPFYNVMLMNNSASKLYLTNLNGEALYYLKSGTCTGQCLTTWAVFDQQQAIVPALLKSSDFKEITRADGTTQLSYKGSPLYTYSGDTQSGDTKGDGQSKLWYLVKP
jgi:predicted lipoprotein with Yx(FWY)xxD motif